MVATLRDTMDFIISTLNGDATLVALHNGIWWYAAPEGTLFPYIIIQKVAGRTSYNLGVESVDTQYITLKAIDMGFDGGNGARAIMERVKFLLNNKTGSVASGNIMIIRDNNEFDFEEQESGNKNFYHIGIIFEIQMTA